MYTSNIAPRQHSTQSSSTQLNPAQPRGIRRFLANCNPCLNQQIVVRSVSHHNSDMRATAADTLTAACTVATVDNLLSAWVQNAPDPTELAERSRLKSKLLNNTTLNADGKLIVNCSTDLSNCTLTALPDLWVKGNLILTNCENLETLPDELRVDGYLLLINCKRLTTLPEKLKVGRLVNDDCQMSEELCAYQLPYDVAVIAEIFTDPDSRI